jgi:hypothetical protein
MQRSLGWQPWPDAAAALSDQTIWLPAGLLLIGFLILIIDAGDRAYWARREA